MKLFLSLIAVVTAQDCTAGSTPPAACLAAVKGSKNCPTGWAAKTTADFATRVGGNASDFPNMFLATPSFCFRALSGSALEAWCVPVVFEAPWPASSRGHQCSIVSNTTDKWLGVGTGTVMNASQAVIVNGDANFSDNVGTYQFTLSNSPRGATAAASATDHKLRPVAAYPVVQNSSPTGKHVIFLVDNDVANGIWAIGSESAAPGAHSSRGTFAFGFTTECVGMALTTATGCDNITTTTTTTTTTKGANGSVLPAVSALVVLLFARFL